MRKIVALLFALAICAVVASTARGTVREAAEKNLPNVIQSPGYADSYGIN